MVKSIVPNLKVDYLGITGSVLCIIHCAATPALLLLATYLRYDVLPVRFLNLDYVFMAINALAVFTTTRQVTIPSVRTVLLGSLAGLTTCLLLEEVSPLFAYGTYLASAGLIAGHLAKIYYSRSHSHETKNVTIQ